MLKFVLIFTLLGPNGEVVSSVTRKLADDKQSCEVARLVMQDEILKSINKGEIQAGFVKCEPVEFTLRREKQT